MSEESGMKVFVVVEGKIDLFLRYEDAVSKLSGKAGTILCVVKTYSYNGETR